MTDISPSLYNKISEEITDLINNNKAISSIIKGFEDGTLKASYEYGYSYAESLGKILSKAFEDNLSSDVLPDGRMYYNIAKSVVEPILKENYGLAEDVAAEIQTALNQASGIGLKGINPGVNQDRIDGIVNRIASEEHFDDVAWILKEPVVNLMQSAVDDTIAANVDFQGESGLRPKVIRISVNKCCDWCDRLAGTYTYPNVPKDVYRRHEFCRCIVEYDGGDGKRQDVWDKKIRTKEESEARVAQQNILSHTTLLNMNLFGDDRRMKLAAMLIEPEDGYNNIFIHGSSQSVSINKTVYNADEFAEYIKANYDNIEEPIKLYGCSCGQGDNSFAQQLSRILEIEVKAAPDDVYLRDDLGVAFIGSEYRNMAEWRIFKNGEEVL